MVLLKGHFMGKETFEGVSQQESSATLAVSPFNIKKTEKLRACVFTML